MATTEYSVVMNEDVSWVRFPASFEKACEMAQKASSNNYGEHYYASLCVTGEPVARETKVFTKGKEGYGR